MDFLSIIILGFIQGIAEFLPISSSAHLIIFSQVRSVPTLMIFKNGELKWRTSGVTPAATLEEELKKYY